MVRLGKKLSTIEQLPSTASRKAPLVPPDQAPRLDRRAAETKHRFSLPSLPGPPCVEDHDPLCREGVEGADGPWIEENHRVEKDPEGYILVLVHRSAVRNVYRISDAILVAVRARRARGRGPDVRYWAGVRALTGGG